MSAFIIVIGLVVTEVLAQLSLRASIANKQSAYMVIGIALYLGYGLGNYLLLKREDLLSASVMQYGGEAAALLVIFLYSRIFLKQKYSSTQWVGLGLGVASLLVLLFGKKGVK